MNPEKSRALIFLLINAFAGLLHYFFQLLAARKLSVEEFGGFSGWLAWVYLGLSLGSVAQYGANFFPVQKRGLKISILLSVSTGLVVTALFFSSKTLSYFEIGFMTLFLAPFSTWLLGQAQRRLLLMTFAFGSLFIAAAKLGIPYFWNSQPAEDIFYWSLPLSSFCGILFLVPFLVKDLSSPVQGVGTDLSYIKTRIAGAVLLSFSAVFIPNIDLVYVDTLKDMEILAPFAQVSLFYKAVFFVILILAQWLLPHQLQQGPGGAPSPRRMKFFVRVCALGLMFSLCSSAVASEFYRIVLGKPFLAPILWVFLSCFNVSLLTGIFLEVQSQVARLKVVDASLTFLTQVVSVLICMYLKLDLVTYLQVQLAVNSILLFLLVLGAGGIFASKFSEQSFNG